MKITFAHMRRMGHIKRWHLVNTSRQQTLAEHSFMVAMIVARMMQKMGSVMTEPMWRHALFHDAAEIAMGDIPTPAKKLISGLAVTRAEQHVGRAIRDEFPWAGTVAAEMVPVQFVAALECADVLEALMWISEHGIGEQAMIARDYVSSVLYERAEHWIKDVPDLLAVVHEIMGEWNSESTLLL
jgi:5'-deoxynucleotidase